MRYDHSFSLIVDWCTSKGMPHSEFLGWEDSDQQKVLASLLETRSRCSSCGTADWEWKKSKSAYIPMRHVCHGCMILDASQQDTESTPGARMVLVPNK